MKKSLAIAGALAGAMAFTPASALAGLTEDTISGVLNFNGGPTNWFDQANGNVPGTSSDIQPLAVVNDPDPGFVEFMFLDGFTGLNVDVDQSTILVHQFAADDSNNNGGTAGSNYFDIWLNDLDFPGGQAIGHVGVLSNQFPGLQVTFGAHSVHLSLPEFSPLPHGGLQALLSIAPVPIPGAVWLGALGLGLVGWAKRRMR